MTLKKIAVRIRINYFKASLWLSGVNFKTGLILEGSVGVGNGFLVHIEENVRLGKDVYLGTFEGRQGILDIGGGTYVGRYTIILAKTEVRIGRNCLIAPFCHITDNNHNFGNPGLTIKEQGLNTKRVIIEDDVWLGAGVSVLPGVVIGKGCVIGARSVVTKSIPSYSIAVGVPARVIRQRDKE